MEASNILDINSRKELYTWFAQNHDKVREFWIRVNRSSKPESGVIGYVDAVEVALCFGWIDSTLKHIDSDKPVQRFSPRRKGSNWCQRNIDRCKRLIEQDEMTEYGLAAIPDGIFYLPKVLPVLKSTIDALSLLQSQVGDFSVIPCTDINMI